MFLRLGKGLSTLPDQPGAQGAEHEELFPRVCLKDKVMPVQRPHLEIRYKLNVVIQELEFVKQILHDKEGQEDMAWALSICIHLTIDLNVHADHYLPQ